MESRNPQLVILGAITPRGDAFKFHQWIKKRPATASLPLVVVDVPPDKQPLYGWRRDEGLRLDAEDYFCRPLKLTALVTVVEDLLCRTARKIRVLVVDDHDIVREGICALLNLQKDIIIIGEAVDGRDAVEKTEQLLPHVVLMDIMMPELNGIEAMRQIKSRCKDVRVLILSQYDDEGSIAESREAGAISFIPKKSVSTGLLKAIRTARRSRRWARYCS
ncbi:MAG: response regulator [Firmicutes bacterium]|nr:response regulator [Bacillota bacterium]